MERLNNSRKREWERLFMIKNLILDLLYPPVCMICGKLLTEKTGLCQDCFRKLQWIEGPRCMCCGKPLVIPDGEYCSDCSKRERGFDAGIGVFPYKNCIRRAVLDLKNNGKKENAAFLGACMAASVRPLLLSWRPQCVVPIPLVPEKMQSRGYNQAALLADAVGQYLHLPVKKNLLYRKNSRREQKQLHRFARKRNTEGVFGVRQGKIPERILLVDDIYTTGSTLEAAACELKRAKAEKVYFVTACMGTDF